MKLFVGLILFLALAEDWGTNYAPHLGAPLGWIHNILVEPLPIKVRPLDLLFLVALIFSRGKKDGRGPNFPPMKSALMVALGTVLFCFVYGVVRGGDFRAASWQTYLMLSTINLAFTLAAVYRTPADFVYLGKWLMAAGAYRALFCWISYFTWARHYVGEGGAFLTTHDDTIPWVTIILVLIVNTIDKRSLKTTARNLALMAFFAGAIQFNSRRLAWVSLLMGIVVTYALFPYGPAKRRVNRTLAMLVPVIILYVVVGWGRPNPIFMPLRSFATVSTQEDASTLARNAENLGLIATGNANGYFLGTGWGHQYICLTRKYDISGFELWQYVPHNSILGLLAYSGTLGFIGFWLALPTAVFLNARVARLTRDVTARNVALIGAAQIIVCCNQLYGDMGLFFFKPMYALGVSYAIALRLPKMAGIWSALPNTAEAKRKGAPATARAPEPVAAQRVDPAARAV